LTAALMAPRPILVTALDGAWHLRQCGVKRVSAATIRQWARRVTPLRLTRAASQRRQDQASFVSDTRQISLRSFESWQEQAPLNKYLNCCRVGQLRLRDRF